MSPVVHMLRKINTLWNFKCAHMQSTTTVQVFPNQPCARDLVGRATAMKCRERGERRRKGRQNSWEAGRGGGSACARLSGKERTHEAGPHERTFIIKRMDFANSVRVPPPPLPMPTLGCRPLSTLVLVNLYL